MDFDTALVLWKIGCRRSLRKEVVVVVVVMPVDDEDTIDDNGAVE